MTRLLVIIGIVIQIANRDTAAIKAG